MRISDWSSDVCSSDLIRKHDATLALVVGDRAIRVLAAEVERDERLAGDVRVGRGRRTDDRIDLLHRHVDLGFTQWLVAARGRCRCRDRGRFTFGCRSRARSEEHTSELQSLMRISYAVFCLKKKNTKTPTNNTNELSNASSETHCMPYRKPT